MSPTLPRPPQHPDLAEVYNQLVKNESISTPEQIAIRRKALNFSLEDVMQGRESTISHEEKEFQGPAGPLKVSIFRPQKVNESLRRDPNYKTPGILHIHGGGHMSGTRFLGMEAPAVLDWVEEFGAVIVSAEYRLAPEHPQPAQLDDSYAALLWMTESAQELGFSPDHLIVCGGSAGGNLAAGVVLLARDRAGPKIRGQLLMYPWLDDSNETNSMHQFGDTPPWTMENNIDALNYALGRNREHANMYTVPSRATDLAGLPPTWIDAGDADVFRDEDVAYASALWKAGVSTELHVWPGCWHGFDIFVPNAPVSRRARAARSQWMHALLF